MFAFVVRLELKIWRVRYSLLTVMKRGLGSAPLIASLLQWDNACAYLTKVKCDSLVAGVCFRFYLNLQELR